MSTFKRLLERAKDKVLDKIAGPPPPEPAPRAAAPAPTPAPPRAGVPVPSPTRDADGGLAHEERLVVVYATANEAEAVADIKRSLAGIETLIKDFDLAREPQTHKQIAKLSGVEVPPYVFVNGRYWGGQYEIATLAASGDLAHVVANRLDRIGAEARRIGRLHDSFSDAVTVDNIVARWRLGHILCVDDLDAWLEVGKDGVERFYYQGGERPLAELQQVAAEIAAGVEGGTMEARWLLEPEVGLH
jgi:hypothetical protein